MQCKLFEIRPNRLYKTLYVQKPIRILYDLIMSGFHVNMR